MAITTPKSIRTIFFSLGYNGNPSFVLVYATSGFHLRKALFASLISMLLFLQPMAASFQPAIAKDSTQIAYKEHPEQDKACSITGTHIPRSWSMSERHTWRDICRGNEVNYNISLGDILDPLDDSDVDKWHNKSRTLRPTFLKDIMMREKFSAAIPQHGIRISAASFPLGIDLTDVTFDRPLVLTHSHFGDTVSMNGFQTSALVSFDGSRFNGKIDLTLSSIIGNLSFASCKFNTANLRGIKILGNLSMLGASFTEALLLDGAIISQNLNMQGTKSNFASLTNVDIGEHAIMRSASFGGPLLMTDASIGGSLDIRENSQFSKVILQGTEFGNDIYMSGSKFLDDVVMESISIGGSLYMNNSARFSLVRLKRAKIGHDLYMDNAIFSDKVEMGSISINGNLYMRKSIFTSVELTGGEIGGIVAMEGSKVKKSLNMESIVTKGHMYLANAEVGPINLNYSRIGGRLATDGGKFRGKFKMHSASIVDSMSLRNAEFEEIEIINVAVGEDLTLDGSKFLKVFYMDSGSTGTDLSLQNTVFLEGTYFIYVKVGSSFDARGSVLRNVDLTGAKIEGELRLGSGSWTIEWIADENARNAEFGPTMLLRNATVGVLQDSKNSWPTSLELEGFSYRYLGGRGANEEDLPQNRGSDWFIDWLSRDASYSPQPYRQLASVFETLGYDSMAGDILFASLERERKEELKPWQFRWWLLSTLRVTIGYGHGLGHFLALAWAIGIALVGTVVLWCWKECDGSGNRLGFWYSLDMLLPVIQLRKEHYNVEMRRKVRYYFYCHKLIGYVLAFFVIAGLAGLAE